MTEEAQRGPWCVVCGAEMNRTNHRFEVKRDGQRLIVAHFKGRSRYEPICGENCLHKKISGWAEELTVRRDAP